MVYLTKDLSIKMLDAKSDVVVRVIEVDPAAIRETNIYYFVDDKGAAEIAEVLADILGVTFEETSRPISLDRGDIAYICCSEALQGAAAISKGAAPVAAGFTLYRVWANSLI